MDVVTRVPMKIKTPPNLGTLRVWTFRSSDGSSSRFFCMASRISEGIPRITTRREAMKESMMWVPAM